MRTLLLAALVAGSAGLARAEEKKPAAASAEAEMMKAWAEFATPGESHKRLEKFVGSWKTHTKFWPKPGAPAMESDGTAEIKLVLGERYLEQRHEGKMMGQPFSGIGYTGFDNAKKKYVGMWMDNLGTSILQTWGQADESGKVIRTAGTVDDPMTKKPMRYEDAISSIDADTFSYEAWQPEPGKKKMYRVMEIVYTRAK